MNKKENKIIKFLKNHIPSRERLKRHRFVNSMFGKIIFDARLWRFNNPRNVAGGLAVGLFCALSPPLPFQIIIFVILASILKINLPVGIAVLSISNVFINLPLYFLFLLIGETILGYDAVNIPKSISEISPGLIKNNLKAYFIGYLTLGSFLSIASYFITYRIIGNYRRGRIKEYFEKRRQRKIALKEKKSKGEKLDE